MSDRPEPEDFGGAAMRLLENGVISEMTAYNLTRATDVTMGEAVRALTDIAIGVRKQFDEYIATTQLWKYEKEE